MVFNIEIRKNPLLFTLFFSLIAFILFFGCTTSIGEQKDPVYILNEDGNPEIYISSPNGKSQKKLTNSDANEYSPKWSPDGKKIAFISDRNEKVQLWVMDPEGENEQLLVDLIGENEQLLIDLSNPEASVMKKPPDFFWAPDSERISYISFFKGQIDLNVVDLSTKTVLPVTKTKATEELGNWSPDGEWIVFTVKSGSNKLGIFKKNPLGVDEIELSDDIGSQPRWSPKGKKIAFISIRDGSEEIYIMDENGENEENISSNDAVDIDFSWSPDGKRLAFISERDENPEVYITTVDGLEKVRLTSNSSSETKPVWAGNRILFLSNSDGDNDLYSMKPDGKDQLRITTSDGEESDPDW